MEQSLQNTLEFLKCIICTEMELDPMECSECNIIICSVCLQEFNKKGKTNCPQCRQGSNFKINKTAQRMIKSLPIQCNLCKKMSNKGDIIQHKEQYCEQKQYFCLIKDCQFYGQQQDFINHIQQNHQEKLLKLFQNIEQIDKINKDDNNNKNSTIDINFDRVCNQTNSKGRQARIGQTGKYYCGGKLEIKCNCCDGNCGINDGCNCSSCMQLDLSSRMLPKGYLVNRDGSVCRRLNNQGKYYCGRHVMHKQGILFSDGYCGPSNGPQCKQCSIIEEQSKGIYKQLI